ncbi:MAG TPA: c-type cytochrome biogenesis protein CcmI [Pyrinomonadaceae bacterium]
MMIFWLVCGVLILIALAFVVPPLWQTETTANDENNELREENVSIYRDQLRELEADLRNGIVSQDQYEQDRDEIKRRLLDDVSNATEPKRSKTNGDRRAAYALAVTLPLLAVALYAKFGNSNARPPETESPPAATAPAAENAGGMSQAQIEANVDRLAKRLESNPSDVQGWIMLARSYNTLGKYDESSKAYEKAVALKPKDADLLANLAFALAMANGQKFDGRPTDLLNQALQIEPDNVNVLGLAGGAAFAQKDYKHAIEYWQKVLKQVPPNSDLAQAVNEKLVEARRLSSTVSP